MRYLGLTAFLIGFALVGSSSTNAQSVNYPSEIRGYKVERASVQHKNEKGSAGRAAALLTLGEPELGQVTPLGITFNVPLIVSPVQQRGRVEFLTFEDIVVNDTSVEIDEYQHPFELPNKDRLTLRDPLNIYVYLPSAVLAAIDNWSNAKEEWHVTGRIYVFGNFKKSIFSAKRCIPVELDLMIRNPLRK